MGLLRPAASHGARSPVVSGSPRSAPIVSLLLCRPRRSTWAFACVLSVLVLSALAIISNIDSADSESRPVMSAGTVIHADTAVRWPANESSSKAPCGKVAHASCNATHALRAPSPSWLRNVTSAESRISPVASRPVLLPSVSVPVLSPRSSSLCPHVPSAPCVFSPLVGNLTDDDSMLPGPQDAYTFHAELHHTTQGPGAFVRIQM